MLAAFTTAGVEAQISDRIEADIWKKFVALAAWSGVSALTRCRLGQVRGDPDTRAMLIAALEGVIAAVRAKGVDLPADAIEQIRTMVLEVAPAGAKASMLEDLERGKPLELPWFSGTVVRLGKALGVPTPTHAFTRPPSNFASTAAPAPTEVPLSDHGVPSYTIPIKN